MPDLLIDGYNLMHSAGLARQTYGPGDLERCRNRLLKRLQRGLELEERRRTIVVFDARYAPDTVRTEQLIRGMRIVFSPSGLEADDVIEEFITAHSAPKRLVVVSSDHRLQRAARSRKAIPVDAETFLDELDRRETDAVPPDAGTRAPPARPRDDLSEQELEEWLEVFDDVDPQEIADDLRRERPTNRHLAPPNAQRPDRQPTVGDPRHSSPDEQVRRSEPRDPDRPAGPRPTADADEFSGGEEMDASSDLSFWEQRIAELFDEDESPPGDSGA